MIVSPGRKTYFRVGWGGGVGEGDMTEKKKKKRGKGNVFLGVR
jgi:hypothetical protein